MVESCQSNSILGPLPNQERCSHNRKVSFEDCNNKPDKIFVSEEFNHSLFTDCKSSRKSLKEKNISLFENFAENFLISVLETLEENNMCNCILEQEKINRFSGKIVAKILQASYEDFIPALMRNKKNLSIEKFADEVISDIFCPIVVTFQSGLLEYSEALSCDILTCATKLAARRLYIERVANIYAEKLSLRVFRDFFIHIITDANRIAYHLLGSYEAVSKNQVRTFAESIIDNIMKDIFPSKRQIISPEPSLVEFFADNFSYDIVQSAINFTTLGREKRSHKESAVSLKVAEKYASRIMQSFFIDVPVLTINSRSTSSRSSFSSTHAICRRDSDDQSEAITPRSAVDESHWKRGIFHFADQLLYSLTALEPYDGSDTVSELGDTIVYRRARRWGSCPHIHEKPLSKDLGARRKSETIVRRRRSLQSFAEDMAFEILYSVMPKAVQCVF